MKQMGLKTETLDSILSRLQNTYLRSHRTGLTLSAQRWLTLLDADTLLDHRYVHQETPEEHAILKWDDNDLTIYLTEENAR